MFHFDQVIRRHGTHSIKYDFAAKRGKPEDSLPLWVADMEFPSPPAVLDALSQRIQHGIFGYSDAADEGYFSALSQWYQTRFHWAPQPDWLIKTPGVVFAVAAAIRALTEQGAAVLIQQPVYYPFEKTIKANGRRLVVNRLLYEEGRYSIDFEAFENQIIEERVKLFILCSPHNPVGRVWTKKELTDLGDICLRHGVYVISDEIHADFVYPGHRHLVFAGLKPNYADITVTCTAPSKTFNLAGLQISNIFIKNERIRRLFSLEMNKAGYNQPNLMGLIACQAAYEQGESWLEELKEYVAENLALVREYCSRELKTIRLVEPEGTYLVWLDCRELGLSDPELNQLVLEKAKLWLDAGTLFGAGGEGFERVNIACPRSTLLQALDRLKEAVESVQGA